ncbi:hypothetical protein Bealeia1_00447 [Candidatus Bealeia paramacronuclearis]|uniref:Uncharacterized protein n=1 Tax=Candidatus Bealeia paramacronuclearis TaxID=1921001 RepID=A0ABZ2C3M7_9PROT|nr:hypothetical protein [Candidatus Bealeia paramacronuclearis]
MKIKKLFVVLIMGALFSCVSHSTQAEKLINQIENELDVINDYRTRISSQKLSLKKLEQLREQFQSPEEFRKAVEPLKSKLLKATEVLIESCLPECACPGFCLVGSLGNGRGIDQIFSFLSHWPLEKDDLKRDLHQIMIGMRFTKTFPDLLDFGKAQSYLTILESKFGEVDPYDLSLFPWSKVALLKTAVKISDCIGPCSCIFPAIAIGFMGFLSYGVSALILPQLSEDLKGWAH